jgi:hypothetical protein
MADFNSSLPVRTQNNGDVVINVADGTTETQLLAISAAGAISLTSGGSVTGGTAASVSQLAGGQYNTVLPTLTNAQQASLQLDAAGRLLVDIGASSGSVSVTQSTSPWVTSDLADGSSTGGTAGTKSLLSGGIYNSTLPTLTTGQQAGLQLDASGRLLVDIGASSGSISVTQGTSPWIVQDSADGSVAAGTAGTKSMLGGLVYNTTAPTLTNGQQVALQGDVNGNLLVDLKTALPAGTNSIGNIGTVTTVTTVSAVTAITNALPAGTNTIGTVNQGNAGTIAQGWYSRITDGTNIAAVKGVSATAGATDPSLVVALSPNSPVPAGTNAIGSVLANLQVSGAAVTVANPVPVTITSASSGTPIQYYSTSASLAAGASATLTYTVPATHTFSFERAWASASGKIKAVVANNGSTIFVGFNSTANPNIDFTITAPPSVAAGNTVTITITNEDKSAFDVYGTIEGNQIS